MKSIRVGYRVILMLYFSLVVAGCKKYLSLKPDSSLVVPENISQAEGLLNHPMINEWYSLVGELADDNLYYAMLPGANTLARQCYTWAPDIDLANVWQLSYRIINACNLAIELVGDPALTGSAADRERIKGEALFVRANVYYFLSQVFVPPYYAGTPDSLYGIPLILSADVQEVLNVKRSTVQQTYRQIISDLEESLTLLPRVPEFKIKPGKAAAQGLLARTLLIMGNYDSAFYYVNLLLEQYGNQLLDYNDTMFNRHPGSPFMRFNKEVIFHATFLSNTSFNREQRIDTALYQSYDTNDLRKQLFFQAENGQGQYKFRGSYSGSATELFCGIALNEMYLIHAECNARRGFTMAAMNDLNTLLVKRWVRGTFVPYTAPNATAALTIILRERRKEIFSACLRWSDLRRLNLDSNYAKTIRRDINGTTYSLSPNDKRYTFLIPKLVIEQTGIAQNPR